jgi:hypothetical protein
MHAKNNHHSVFEAMLAGPRVIPSGREAAGDQPHEGSFPETLVLDLDSSRARSRPGWQPALDFAGIVALTAEWCRKFHARPSCAAEFDRGANRPLSRPTVVALLEMSSPGSGVPS